MPATLALPVLDTQPIRPDFARGPRSLQAVQLLRISVTDRCNLRCVYCMPEEGVGFSHQDDLLSARDFVAVAQAAAEVGVKHFKITGGEPTVRSDVLSIVKGIAALAPGDLSMTTNGLTLHRQATALRDAGLHRLTVSWDSMRPDRLARITGYRGPAVEQTGRHLLDQLRRGLDAAVAAGFHRLKLNVVVMGGINDDEVTDFARLTLDHPWTVRFIEYMPLGNSRLVDAASLYMVDNDQILARIGADLGDPEPVSRKEEVGVGPADVYRLPGAPGRIGFISAMSRPFCETCNRLRLTARGELRACLFDGGEVDLMPALRPTVDRRRITSLMANCVALKPETHSMRGNRAMSQLGG
jgi:cyclic pyranopterin phosphate synthase